MFFLCKLYIFAMHYEDTISIISITKQWTLDRDGIDMQTKTETRNRSSLAACGRKNKDKIRYIFMWQQYIFLTSIYIVKVTSTSRIRGTFLYKKILARLGFAKERRWAPRTELGVHRFREELGHWNTH